MFPTNTVNTITVIKIFLIQNTKEMSVVETVY
jgi:hypothetical protein